MKSPRGVALLGFMGAGKTTVGRALASRMGWRFVDLDEELVRLHGPIGEQFQNHGEQRFRERESAALLAVEPSRTVLAVGGGTPVDARNRGELERKFRTVWLDVDLNTVALRVGRDNQRPLWQEAEQLFATRRPLYRSARSRVDASLPVAEVVDAILAGLDERVERVVLPHSSYDVVIAHDFDGLEARVPPASCVITDSTVGPLWAAATGLDAHPIVFPAGEEHKTLHTWRHVVDALIARPVRRDSAVVALGGGVVGDLAGFAAATVNRGCRLIQVPTTTLAMVDSSVGGKTAVNHPEGKNLVGAFHQPELVWANLATLQTLSPEERISGLAEVLKMALCLDGDLLDLLEIHADAARQGDPFLIEHLVAMSVRMKALVVQQDEREAGARMVLNAGHTVAHGLERACRFGTLRHGEAVAIGLFQECRWAEAMGFTEVGLSTRIRRISAALGLPSELPEDLDRDAVVAAMQVDKKARRDTLWLPIPVRAGVSERIRVPVQDLVKLLTVTK